MRSSQFEDGRGSLSKGWQPLNESRGGHLSRMNILGRKIIYAREHDVKNDAGAPAVSRHSTQIVSEIGCYKKYLLRSLCSHTQYIPSVYCQERGSLLAAGMTLCRKHSTFLDKNLALLDQSLR